MAATNAAPAAPGQRSGFGRFWLALRQLFHELVGAVFAVLALAWVQSAIGAWTRDGARWLVATAFVVAAVMAVFSFTSFRCARRVQRLGSGSGSIR
jgi:hypothetical protein